MQNGKQQSLEAFILAALLAFAKKIDTKKFPLYCVFFMIFEQKVSAILRFFEIV